MLNLRLTFNKLVHCLVGITSPRVPVPFLPEASPKTAQSSHWGNLWDFCLVPVVVVVVAVITNQQNNSTYKTNKQIKKGQFAECQRVDAARLEDNRGQRAVVDNWAQPGVFWLYVI